MSDHKFMALAKMDCVLESFDEQIVEKEIFESTHMDAEARVQYIRTVEVADDKVSDIEK